MSESAAEPRRFHPSWPAFHRRALARMLFLGPLLLLTLLIASWPRIGLAFLLVGGGLVIWGTAAAVYFARTRASVADGVLRIRGPLRTRRWSLPAVGTLVFVPMPGSRLATLYGVSPVLERMFSLSGDAWEQEELESLAEAIGAPIVRAPAGLPPRELQERFPGTVGWTSTRPWLVVLLLAVGSVALMLVATLVVAAILVASGEVPLPAR